MARTAAAAVQTFRPLTASLKRCPDTNPNQDFLSECADTNPDRFLSGWFGTDLLNRMATRNSKNGIGILVHVVRLGHMEHSPQYERMVRPTVRCPVF
jgi:hypothetical protein